MSLPIYNTRDIQSWDAFTISNEPISSLDLMERAASRATKYILGNFLFESVSIFCGPGNNGGDGLVIARLLSEVNKEVTVYRVSSDHYSNDHLHNFEKIKKTVTVIELNNDNSNLETKSDLIIDAIFGSGLSKPITGWLSKTIEYINSETCPIVAIDIPSGVFADKRADKSSTIVHADCTITFMSPKYAFIFEESCKFVGKLCILNIDLSPSFSAAPIANFVEAKDIRIYSRDQFSHKGKNGYLSLIAGLGNMSGAGVISASAAMRSGAGYVGLISTEKTFSATLTECPEVIYQDVNHFQLSPKTTAIAIGPGIGTDEQSVSLLKNVLDQNYPIILDADALNLIAASEKLKSVIKPNTILTPHVAELIRLVGGDSKDGFDLLERQIAYSKKYKVYIIQKGPYSKLTCPNGEIFINSTGNPGMASAGMGDALTGIIGGLLAQGYSSKEAALNGMFIHGYAADKYARNVGEIGLLASDVIRELPKVLNEFATKISK